MRAPSRLAAVMLTCSSLDSRRCGTTRSSAVGSSDGDRGAKDENGPYCSKSGSEVDASPQTQQERDAAKAARSRAAAEEALSRVAAEAAAKREFQQTVRVDVVVSEPQRLGLSQYFADEKRVLDRGLSPPGDHMPRTTGSCRCQASGAQQKQAWFHRLVPQRAIPPAPRAQGGASRRRQSRSGWVPTISGVAYARLCLYSYVVACLLASLEKVRGY